ncbi:MAG: butyrate kinase [Muribaculaceae bacterium]|nr:butyrate kinase [Muribaculaceae bacterium]
MKLLTVNPGSTSTKIAVYEDLKPILTSTIRHSVEDLAPFNRVQDQFEMRLNLVLEELERDGIPLQFDAVVGRGGLLKPIAGGVYEVNDVMLREMEHPLRSHACNLGCRIAYEIAKRIPDCRAFMADPGVVDELEDVARVSGSPLMPRITTWHALNQRAIARRFAKEHCGPLKYKDLDLIICHLGGGISVGAHKHGRCIDVNNAFDGEGPFSPERAGSLPAGSLIDLCYSGKYTIDELKKRISGKAGLASHLGTTDVSAIVDRINDGDSHARLILDAMIYNIAKTIGAAAVVLYGKVDAILLTGGIAHSEYVTDRITERVKFLAPVYIYPGEDEMLALATNGEGALKGELEIKEYV